MTFSFTFVSLFLLNFDSTHSSFYSVWGTVLGWSPGCLVLNVHRGQSALLPKTLSWAACTHVLLDWPNPSQFQLLNTCWVFWVSSLLWHFKYPIFLLCCLLHKHWYHARFCFVLFLFTLVGLLLSDHSWEIMGIPCYLLLIYMLSMWFLFSFLPPSLLPFFSSI